MKEPKAIEQARAAGLTVHVVTYKAQGFRMRRKGYHITDPATGKTTVVKPKTYPKGSIYAKDKWRIDNDGGRWRYVNRLTIEGITP